ncbi:MAG: type II secretion system protein [Limisphaerales bacterium]
MTEILCVVVAVLFLAALALTFVTKKQGRRHFGQCQNNLKQVSLAFRVWANDNNDKFPYLTTNCLAYTNEALAWLHFYVMSNELGSARILTCPQDAQRLSNSVSDFTASSMGLLSQSNRAVSYFVGLEADETKPNALLSGDRNLLWLSTSTLGQVVSLATNTPFHWGRDLHTNRGNIALADGSVSLLDRRELLTQLGHSHGLSTNRLLMPLVPKP